jgi:ferritin-like metal-binding protein YciE
MASKNLDDLFNDGLKDVYYAERKILTALPKMAASAQTAKLKEAFEKHHEETQSHVERLHQIFELLGKPVKAKTCPAVDAIIEEGEEILDKFKESPALDLGLIAGAQVVEHYEIARYSALKKWSLALGYSEAVDLIDATLQEELKTDADLGSLSDSLGNSKTFKSAR